MQPHNHGSARLILPNPIFHITQRLSLLLLGFPPLTARPTDPQGLGQPRGGGVPSPPTYSPPNCRTPLGVTHSLAVSKCLQVADFAVIHLIH